MKEKTASTGIFLCRCGANIAGFVDLDEIAAWAKSKPSVLFVETHNLLCSPDGKKFVQEKVAQCKSDHVVVAACSPKMHEKTFRDVAGKSGMNMAQVHMANIREQCGWVTSDKSQATQKAKTLINAAIQRIALHQDLQPRFMDCLTDIAIIGGGIAGIEAALTAANAGRKVTIFERDISLGGAVIKTEEVAPNMECAPCLLAPRLSAIRENKNITVVTNAEVTDVLGFSGNFTVKAQKKPRYVKDNCIGCEACFEVCPVSVPSSFHLGMGNRKAVYTAFPGSVPAAAVIDKENCKHFADGSCNACVEACPFQSIDFEDTGGEIEIKAGAVIIATGSDSFDPSGIDRFGYGKIDNVVTISEFERMASSNGPFGGQVRLKNGKPPASIAVIHCVGSLCAEEGVAYCSGICCMTAAKVGELARKSNAGVQVRHIHDRLVFDGPLMSAFFGKQVEKGTQFQKCTDLRSVRIERKGEGISVTGEGFEPLTAEMVVLVTAVVPAQHTSRLAELLNIDLDSAGFYKPDHPILHATGASIDGLYAAGSCASPATAATAITRAQAAAGNALARLVPGRQIELEVMTTVIDEKLCAGCKLCISVCPYKAVTFDSVKKISVVNEAICRGCGTCAATCGGGATSARHFTNEQIYAEIGGVLHG